MSYLLAIDLLAKKQSVKKSGKIRLDENPRKVSEETIQY